MCCRQLGLLPTASLPPICRTTRSSSLQEPAPNLQNNTEQLTFAADLPSECSSQAFRRDLWNTSLPRKSFAKGKWLKRKELNYQGRSCAMPDPGVSTPLTCKAICRGRTSWRSCRKFRQPHVACSNMFLPRCPGSAGDP